MSDEKIQIELYGPQHDFVACEDRFTAFIGGVGSGKTYGGTVKAIGQMQRPTLGLVVAPTYPMLRDATLRTFTEITEPWMTDFHKAEMRAEMITGAEVLFRSADTPDRLRGPNLHWAWIDEGALCPDQTWEIVIGRLRAEGGAGPCWITTTPKGRNWVYDRQGQLTVFRAATGDNPYLDQAFIDSLQGAYSGLFARQELFGEFVAFEGLVYDEFDRGTHIKENLKPFRRYLVGVDEGYTNPSVASVIGFDHDGRAHIVEEFYQRRVLQDVFVAVCAKIKDKYDPEAFYVDPSAAGLIAAMQRQGLPVAEADNEVNDGIQRVKARFMVQGDGKPRLTVAPRCANHINEFESYMWAKDRSGREKDKPVKENDHAMDAIRYVFNGLAGARPPLPRVHVSIKRR